MSPLQTTLVETIQSGWQSNPALTTLIHDYTKYHIALVVAGGILLLTTLAMSWWLWLKFKNATNTSERKWPFEKKVYFAFGSLLTVFSLLFVVIWIANLSTALNPLPGFTSLARSTNLEADSPAGKVLDEWVQSGTPLFPPILQDKVQNRIDWQRPKAIICGLLLMIFTFACFRIWRYLIKRSKVNETTWSLIDRGLMFVGGMSFAACLLLAIMTVANAQGAIGPIVISLLGIGS